MIVNMHVALYCSVLRCVAVCYSVLQHVAVRCRVLFCVAVCYKKKITLHALHHTATHCNTLQHTGIHRNALSNVHTDDLSATLKIHPPHLGRVMAHHLQPTQQHTATHCNTLQHTATRYNTLQILEHTAAHCNTLQHTATYCNILQHC